MRWLALLTLSIALYGAQSSECVQKHYGDEYIVCVCNATYCDVLEEVKLSEDEYVVYESSMAGDRLKTTVTKFEENKSINNNDEVLIKLDPSKQYQTILGFGGAFTDSVGVNLLSVDEDLQHQILSQYFGPKGIGYTIGRVPIASSDFSASAYSYLDTPNDFNLSTFALNEVDFTQKIPFVHKAAELKGSPLRLFASPWSAPGWMKTTGGMLHGGKLLGDTHGKYYRTWAQYFVRFFEEYHKSGLDFWAVTTENEPWNGLIPFFPFQSMYLSSADQRDFVKLHLGPLLRANNVTKDVKIIINDDNVHRLPEYVRRPLQDPESAKYIDGIGIHWYLNDATNMDKLLETHELFPDKFIMGTEACAGAEIFDKGPAMGLWQRGVRYARDMIDTLSRWAVAWTDWNIVLDLTGGPNFVNNRVDSPLILNASAAEFYKQPAFYAMAHFSKFVVPGSVRIEHDMLGAPPSLRSIVFRTPTGRRVMVLLSEEDEKSIDVRIKDPNRGLGLVHTLQPNSFTTIVWDKKRD